MADVEGFKKNFSDVIEGVQAVLDAEHEAREQQAERFLSGETIHAGTVTELHQMGREAAVLLADSYTDPDFLMFERTDRITRRETGESIALLARGWLVSSVRAESNFEVIPGVKTSGSYLVAGHEYYYLLADHEGGGAYARTDRYIEGPELIHAKTLWSLERHPQFLDHASAEHPRSIARIPKLQEDIVRLLINNQVL